MFKPAHAKRVWNTAYGYMNELAAGEDAPMGPQDNALFKRLFFALVILAAVVALLVLLA